MTQTNAQAALVAAATHLAANAALTQDSLSHEDVLKQTEEYKAWLDKEDAKERRRAQESHAPTGPIAIQYPPGV